MEESERYLEGDSIELCDHFESQVWKRAKVQIISQSED